MLDGALKRAGVSIRLLRLTAYGSVEGVCPSPLAPTFCLRIVSLETFFQFCFTGISSLRIGSVCRFLLTLCDCSGCTRNCGSGRFRLVSGRMRLNQFLAEYEREFSKRKERRRPSSANKATRLSQRAPGSAKPVPCPKVRSERDFHQQPLRVASSSSGVMSTFEDELSEAVRRKKLKIKLEGFGSPDGRVWSTAATDRTGVKKVDDDREQSPDKHSALALREIQLTAQGNVQRLSKVIRLAKDIRVVESGIGSSGGHIAREMGSPGPINGHNLVRPWEKAHVDNFSEAQENEILVPPRDVIHPRWDQNHVTAKLLSLHVPPEKLVKDPLFLREIEQFRTLEAVPKADYSGTLPSSSSSSASCARPGSAPASSVVDKAKLDAMDDKERTVESMFSGSETASASASATLPSASPSLLRELTSSQLKWAAAVKQLRNTAKELTYRDLTELIAMREPPEQFADLVSFISVLLGLQPTWAAARRSLFKELQSLHNFLRQVDPLTVPMRRLRKAAELRRTKLSFLSPESPPLGHVSKSAVFEKLALWVLSFDAIARIIIAVEESRLQRQHQQQREQRGDNPDFDGAPLYAYPIIAASGVDVSSFGLKEEALGPSSPSVQDMRKRMEENRVLGEQMRAKEDAKVPSRIVAEARKKYRSGLKVIMQTFNTAKPSKFDARPRSAGPLGARSSKRSSSSLKSAPSEAVLGATDGGQGEAADRISGGNVDVLSFFQSLAADKSLLDQWVSSSSPKSFSLMAQASRAAASVEGDLFFTTERRSAPSLSPMPSNLSSSTTALRSALKTDTRPSSPDSPPTSSRVKFVMADRDPDSAGGVGSPVAAAAAITKSPSREEDYGEDFDL